MEESDKIEMENIRDMANELLREEPVISSEAVAIVIHGLLVLKVSAQLASQLKQGLRVN